MINFLYIPNLPQDEVLLDKVCDQFLKKAFISTDAVLIVLVKSALDSMRYVKKWMYKTFGSNCQIVCFETGKFYGGLLNYSEVMDGVDCYISGSMTSEEYIYTEMAYDKGKHIISAHSDDIFEDLPPDLAKIQKRKEVSALIKKIHSDYPMDEYEWMLLDQGLGEVCAFFYYVKAYAEKNDRKICAFCYDETRVSLFEECPYIDKVIRVSLSTYAYIAIYMADHFKIKNFILLHFLPFSTDRLYKPRDIYPIYMPKVREFLELNENIPFERYPVNVSPAKIDYVNNLFNEMSLIRDKTVFLIMDGITNGDFSKSHKDFFVALIDALRTKGYDVVTKGKTEFIPGCKYTFLKPWESALFAGLCGNVVSIPTGIPIAIGALNQSDYINIHMLWLNVENQVIKNSYDAWNIDYIPIFRGFGKKYFLNNTITMHELMANMMFSKKINFISYTDAEWNSQTIEKIIANLKLEKM